MLYCPERNTYIDPKMEFNSSVDHFDRLPDSLLLLVFNKFGDIKALGRCRAVSKRFSTIVPQVQNVVVKVDCVISSEETNLNNSGKNRGIWNYVMRIMMGVIVRPWQALQHILSPKKSIVTDVSFELPGGELGIEDGVLLKWKAVFGSTLESCVILGASSVFNPAKDKRDGNCDSEKSSLLQGKGWSGLLKSIRFCFVLLVFSASL